MGWVATGQAFVVLGGLVGIKVLTSLLTPSDYGLLTLGLTFTALSQQVWAGPLLQALARNVSPLKQLGRLDVLIATGRVACLGLASAQTLVLGAGICAAAVLFDLDVHLRNVLLLGALLAAIQATFDIAQGVRGQLRQRRAVALRQGTFTLARPLCAAAVVMMCGAGANWAMLGIITATAAFTVLDSKWMAGLTAGAKHSTELARDVVRFAVPYVGWGLMSWGVTAGDRWILQVTNNGDLVGLYAVAIQIGTIIPRVMGSLINTFLAPILCEIAGSGKERNSVQRAVAINAVAIALFAACGAIGALAMALLSGPLVTMLTGPGYEQIAAVLPWLFLGAVINEIASLCFTVGPLLYNPQAFMKPRMAAYAVTFCLMAGCTALWKLEGMVAAVVLGALAQLTVNGFTAIRLYKQAMVRL